MLPSGGGQLVIALHEEPSTWADGKGPAVWHPWTRGIVHGPQSTFYRTGPKPAGAVMGAAFRPGGMGAILRVPAPELLDRHVTLDELWGARGLELRERLATAPSARSALLLLEQGLVARLKTPGFIHPAVAHALRESHRKPVDLVRRETGYSHRHFVALFRSAVGLGPKHFCRIRRFAEAAGQLAMEEVSLADLAQRLGYSDQGHFTREFRELCGVPPTAYQPSAPWSPYHHVAG
jgi:AraC-like DNA-binding protein